MRTPRIALFAATAALVGLVGLPMAAAPAGAAESNELTLSQ